MFFFKRSSAKNKIQKEIKVSQYPNNRMEDDVEQEKKETMKIVYASPEQFAGSKANNARQATMNTIYDSPLAPIDPEKNKWDALLICVACNCSMLISRAKHLSSMQYSLNQFEDIIKELDSIAEDLKRLGSMSEDAVRMRDEIEKEMMRKEGQR